MAEHCTASAAADTAAAVATDTTEAAAARPWVVLQANVDGMAQSVAAGRVLAQAAAALVESLRGCERAHDDMGHLFEAVYTAAMGACEDLAAARCTLHLAEAAGQPVGHVCSVLHQVDDAVSKALAVAEAGVAWVAAMKCTELDPDVLAGLFGVVVDVLQASCGTLASLSERLQHGQA